MSDNSTAQPTPERSSVQMNDSDEISLVDILRFIQRQFRVISGLTVVAVLLGLGTAISTSAQFRRELLLRIELSPLLTFQMPTTTLGQAALSTPQIEQTIRNEIQAAGTLALADHFSEQANPAVQSPVNGTVEAVPLTATGQVPDYLQITLSSENPIALDTVSQSALNVLETAADNVAQGYVEREIERLELLVQRTEEKVDFLEERLASVPDLQEGDTSDTLLRFLQFQQQQAILAETFGILADYQLERAMLTDTQGKDDRLVTIEVVKDTESQETASLLQRLVLSAIAGLLLGILLAMLIDQMPHIRAALSEAKS